MIKNNIEYCDVCGKENYPLYTDGEKWVKSLNNLMGGEFPLDLIICWSCYQKVDSAARDGARGMLFKITIEARKNRSKYINELRNFPINFGNKFDFVSKRFAGASLLYGY